MLEVVDLAKRYPGPYRTDLLFQNLSFSLAAGGRLAVLGRNGQGKSTLIKILGGVLAQTSGSVNWSMKASWPLGFGGAFHGSLTGADNVRFIARIYDKPMSHVAEATERFAQLGDAMSKPVRNYSSGMRARLAFGLSLAIEFDCYLIDEVISVGDVTFQEKCHYELFDRRGDRAFIIASHDLEFLRRTCDSALIIEGGHAKYFDDLELAMDIYSTVASPDQFNDYARIEPLSAAS